MLEHIKQSITDIITTPLGSRVMRRDYGSRAFDYIDAPTNAQFNANMYFAIAQALQRWEPRVRVKKMSLTKPSKGVVLISLDFWVVLKNGTRLLVRQDNIALGGAA